MQDRFTVTEDYEVVPEDAEDSNEAVYERWREEIPYDEELDFDSNPITEYVPDLDEDMWESGDGDEYLP